MHIHKNKQPSNKEVLFSLFIHHQLTSKWPVQNLEVAMVGNGMRLSMQRLANCFSHVALSCAHHSWIAFTQLWQTLKVEQSLSKLKKSQNVSCRYLGYFFSLLCLLCVSFDADEFHFKGQSSIRRYSAETKQKNGPQSSIIKHANGIGIYEW